jgi:hypothetical protein
MPSLEALSIAKSIIISSSKAVHSSRSYIFLSLVVWISFVIWILKFVFYYYGSYAASIPLGSVLASL